MKSMLALIAVIGFAVPGIAASFNNTVAEAMKRGFEGRNVKLSGDIQLQSAGVWDSINTGFYNMEDQASGNNYMGTDKVFNITKEKHFVAKFNTIVEGKVRSDKCQANVQNSTPNRYKTITYTYKGVDLISRYAKEQAGPNTAVIIFSDCGENSPYNSTVLEIDPTLIN